MKITLEDIRGYIEYSNLLEEKKSLIRNNDSLTPKEKISLCMLENSKAEKELDSETSSKYSYIYWMLKESVSANVLICIISLIFVSSVIFLGRFYIGFGGQESIVMEYILKFILICTTIYKYVYTYKLIKLKNTIKKIKKVINLE